MDRGAAGGRGAFPICADSSWAGMMMPSVLTPSCSMDGDFGRDAGPFAASQSFPSVSFRCNGGWNARR